MLIRLKPNSKYFYTLDNHDTGSVRLIGFAGLVSLVFLVIGFINFLKISPLISILFGPLLLIIAAYHLINYWLMAQYPGFDITKHRSLVADFKRRGWPYPRVAVFVPAAGEDVKIVRETVTAAMAINYPAFAVFILDDSKDGIYKELAEHLGCRYLRRPNIGHQKKAGNMNYALSQIDGYEWVLILDADFKARREILAELMPYTASDVGIVQSPQHFPMTKEVHTRSKIEYGAAYIQQDFYRITQVARDKFGAAICVGTNALYNVSAVKQVDGWEGVGAPKGWGHSEDVHTGLKMINKFNSDGDRYRIKYVPIQLAEGYCPDTHYAFYKQQNRWCTGSMQLLFSGKTLFSKTLSLPQRLIYGSSSLYYYYTISLLTSPLYLLTITLLNNQLSWWNTLYFLPTLVTNVVITPLVLRKQYRPLATGLVVMSNAYTFLQALMLLILQKPLDWQASGATKNSRTRHFSQFKLLALLGFTLLYVLTFGAIMLDDKIALGPSMIIVAIFLSALTLHFGFMYYLLIGGIDKPKRIYQDRKFYAAVAMTLFFIAVGCLSYTYHSRYQVVFGHNDVITLENQDGRLDAPASKPHATHESMPASKSVSAKEAAQ